MTWHQTCSSPRVSPSPCWSFHFPAVFKGDVKAGPQERSKLRWKYIPTPCGIFPGRSRENRYLIFLTEQTGGVNDGQFEENYYRFLVHLKNLLVGDTLCFSFKFLFWSPAQPVSRVFPLKRFLTGKNICAYIPIAVFLLLWETPVKKCTKENRQTK